MPAIKPQKMTPPESAGPLHTRWCVPLANGQQLHVTCAASPVTDDMRRMLSNIRNLPAQAEVLKNDPQSSIVTSVVVDGRRLVIKDSVNRGWWRMLRRCWRRSRASNAWYFSHLLLSAGINTPEPVALVERKWGPLVLESWFVCEHLEADNLLDVWLYQEPTAQELETIGKLFRTMKTRHMSHGDMKATNLLVANDRIYLIDFDGTRHHSTNYMLKKGLERDKQRFLRNWKKPELVALLRDRIERILA